MHAPASVPRDFPYDPFPSAVSGVQPKLSVRRVNGQFVQGISDDERAERFAICADLAEQLVVYCRRKHAERPDESMEELLQRIEDATRVKAWDVSPIELTWCFNRVNERLFTIGQ